MENYLGLIELVLVFLCLIAGWAIMEWQGRRLDRARAAREKKE
jgi:cbb3-type cytochrome oxidase subunit 3